MEPVNACTKPAHARAEAEPVQNRKAGGLQDQAGPDGPWRIELVEQRDAVALAAERKGSGKPGGAGPCDGDIKRASHG